MTYTKKDGRQCEAKLSDTRSCCVEVNLCNDDGIMEKPNMCSCVPQWLKVLMGLVLIIGAVGCCYALCCSHLHGSGRDINPETVPFQTKPEALYRNTGDETGQAASAMLYMNVSKVFENKENCTNLRRVDYMTNSSTVDSFLNKVEYVEDKGGLKILLDGTYHVFSQVTVTSNIEKVGCYKPFDGTRFIHAILINSNKRRAARGMTKLPIPIAHNITMQPSYLSANLRLKAGDVVYVYVSDIYSVYRGTTDNYFGLLQL